MQQAFLASLEPVVPRTGQRGVHAPAVVQHEDDVLRQIRQRGVRAVRVDEARAVGEQALGFGLLADVEAADVLQPDERDAVLVAVQQVCEHVAHVVRDEQQVHLHAIAILRRCEIVCARAHSAVASAESTLSKTSTTSSSYANKKTFRHT